MSRLGTTLALAWTTLACNSKSHAPVSCVYNNAQYSVGATVCAPGIASEPMHIVLECTFNGADEPPRWIHTGKPCDAPGSSPAGSGS